jgi:hypothetical protein
MDVEATVRGNLEHLGRKKLPKSGNNDHCGIPDPELSGYLSRTEALRLKERQLVRLGY